MSLQHCCIRNTDPPKPHHLSSHGTCSSMAFIKLHLTQDDIIIEPIDMSGYSKLTVGLILTTGKSLVSLSSPSNFLNYQGHIYVSPRRGIRFVLHSVSDRSLSLCHFLPSFWNNSATVREGVTKFEMPRQKLLKKCLFLFIAPFDL